MREAIAYVRKNAPEVVVVAPWSPVESPGADDESMEESDGGPAAAAGNGIRRPDPSWPLLGMLLVREGFVTDDELDRALAQQRLSSSKRLGEILVERGSVSRRDIASVLAEQYELPFVDIVESELDPTITALLPVDVARRHKALPVGFQPDGTLRLAVADPTKAQDLDEITAVLGARLSFAVADPDTIELVLAGAGRPQEIEHVEVAGDATDEGSEGAVADERAVDETASNEDEPVQAAERVEDQPPQQWAEVADEPAQLLSVVDDGPWAPVVVDVPDQPLADEPAVEAELALLDEAVPDEPAEVVFEAVGDEPAVEAELALPNEAVVDEPAEVVFEAEGDEPEEEQPAEPEEPAEAEEERSVLAGLLERAASLAASAVHVSPRETGHVIRARVDGVLRELDLASGDEQHALSRELEQVPSVVGDEWDVTELPTRHGRALTLTRRRAVEPASLDELGLAAEAHDVLSRALRRPSGLVLVAGPRGSGTAVTFHAALRELVSPETAVLTVEADDADPVPGVDQIPVGEASGLTFASGLRRILGADPDAIGVGELADRETSQLAVSASTSSLVVATVRAQGAVEAVARLTAKGVDREVLAGTLEAVVAQRLVRTLCTRCRESYYATDEDLAALDRPEDEAGRRLLGRGKGCAACGGTGFSGSVAIYEVLSPTEELRALLAEGAPSSDLESAAPGAGMRTLRDEAVRLCLDGATTVAELRRAFGPGAA
jgi:type II secretory ATPase GspE/PulE/Tfp pilus assembly ATPase PilB-like protein